MQQGDRRREFKKGLDGDSARRARVEQALSLRKKERNETLQKRRMMSPPNSPSTATQPTSPATLEKDFLLKLKNLPNIIAGINSDDGEKQLKCTQELRKLMCIKGNPPIEAVVSTNIIPRLVLFLESPNSGLVYEAAWTLTNIASGESKFTKEVVKHNALPRLITLLSCDSSKVREQCCWALANISGDGYQLRDMTLGLGALQPLLQLCAPNQPVSLTRVVTWTISNLCRGKPRPDFQKVSPAIKVLAALLQTSRDEDVLVDTCWAFSYLSGDTQKDKISALIRGGIVKPLVTLLRHHSDRVSHPALQCLARMLCGDMYQMQVVMNNGMLEAVRDLLINSKKAIRKEACWAISNITGGNKEQIQAVFNAQLVPPLKKILAEDHFDVKKEATWALCNAATGGNHEQIKYLASQGMIQPICRMLDVQQPRLQVTCLKAIAAFLRVGENLKAKLPEWQGRNKFAEHIEEVGGLDKIEGIQTIEHVEQSVYRRAVKLIETYWGSSDNAEQPSTAPQVNATKNQFAFGLPSGQSTPVKGSLPTQQTNTPTFKPATLPNHPPKPAQ